MPHLCFYFWKFQFPCVKPWPLSCAGHEARQCSSPASWCGGGGWCSHQVAGPPPWRSSKIGLLSTFVHCFMYFLSLLPDVFPSWVLLLVHCWAVLGLYVVQGLHQADAGDSVQAGTCLVSVFFVLHFSLKWVWARIWMINWAYILKKKTFYKLYIQGGFIKGNYWWGEI